MGGDHVGRKRGVHFLKDNRNNVVSNVALALELLVVTFHIWQPCRDVKHDLIALVLLVKGMCPRLPMSGVEAATVPRVIAQPHLLAEQLHELGHGRRMSLVAENGLLRALSEFLVNDAEFEGVAEAVLVKVRD